MNYFYLNIVRKNIIIYNFIDFFMYKIIRLRHIILSIIPCTFKSFVVLILKMLIFGGS